MYNHKNIEYIFIASYYRQLSADIKMKNFKIETSFVSRDIHAFSVWLRTGSNPADSNRFRSHTGNSL